MWPAGLIGLTGGHTLLLQNEQRNSLSEYFFKAFCKQKYAKAVHVVAFRKSWWLGADHFCHVELVNRMSEYKFTFLLNLQMTNNL